MIELYHPICHLACGERLYYLLIDSKMNIDETKKYIIECLNKVKTKDSCCGYVTFGVSDIILRIWTDDERIRKLLILFREDRTKIVDVKIYLIQSTYTWYQKNIESKPEFWTYFGPSTFKNLISNQIPPDIFKHIEKRRNIKGVRFFTFFDEEYTTYSRLFEKLYEYLNDKNKDKYFKNISYVSIYSYQTDEYQGVLLKGNAKNLEDISVFIDNITNEFTLQTTTCICASKLLQEMDWVVRETQTKNITLQKEPAVYNLLKTHDCFRRRFDAIENASKIHVRFCELFDLELTKTLFWYTRNWQFVIEQIRKIYRWVIFQKNAALRDFLMGQYVSIERDFREKLKNFVSIIDNDESEFDKHKFDKYKIMWGKIGKGIGKLKEYAKLGQDNNKKIQYVIDVINKCKDNRNHLLHGEVMDLFQTDKDGKSFWEEYVLNYIRLILSLELHKELLAKLLENANKNFTCKNKT